MMLTALAAIWSRQLEHSQVLVSSTHHPVGEADGGHPCVKGGVGEEGGQGEEQAAQEEAAPPGHGSRGLRGWGGGLFTCQIEEQREDPPT